YRALCPVRNTHARRGQKDPGSHRNRDQLESHHLRSPARLLAQTYRGTAVGLDRNRDRGRSHSSARRCRRRRQMPLDLSLFSLCASFTNRCELYVGQALVSSHSCSLMTTNNKSSSPKH